LKNESFIHDIAFDHYSNGGVVLHSGVMRISLGADFYSGLDRQLSQVKFKIALTLRKTPSLAQAQQSGMSDFMAKEWGQRATDAPTKDYIAVKRA
jgi:hypothetical protein